MLQDMVKGKLSRRLNLKQKDEIGILGENLDLFADNLQINVVGTMKKISEGDLNLHIEVKDPEDEISPIMKATVNNLKALVREAEMLTEAAVQGRLSTRGDAQAFEGGYKEIVAGVNATLDAVIGPLNVAANYVDRISKGDIPEKITDAYNGDFNTLKENLNSCIEAVNNLVEDAVMLSDAAIAGDFMKRADTSKHQGDFRKVVEGVNGTLDVVADKAVWYMAIIDAIPFPIHVTDMDMKWTLFNKAFERVMIDTGVVKCREDAYGK